MLGGGDRASSIRPSTGLSLDVSGLNVHSSAPSPLTGTSNGQSSPFASISMFQQQQQHFQHIAQPQPTHAAHPAHHQPQHFLHHARSTDVFTYNMPTPTSPASPSPSVGSQQAHHHHLNRSQSVSSLATMNAQAAQVQAQANRHPLAYSTQPQAASTPSSGETERGFVQQQQTQPMAMSQNYRPDSINPSGSGGDDDSNSATAAQVQRLHQLQLQQQQRHQQQQHFAMPSTHYINANGPTYPLPSSSSLLGRAPPITTSGVGYLDSSSASTSSFDTLKSPLEEDEDNRYPENERHAFHFDPSSHYQHHPNHERLHVTTDVDREIEEALGGSPIEEDEIDIYYGKSASSRGMHSFGGAGDTMGGFGGPPPSGDTFRRISGKQHPMTASGGGNGSGPGSEPLGDDSVRPTGGNGVDSQSSRVDSGTHGPGAGGANTGAGAASGAPGSSDQSIGAVTSAGGGSVTAVVAGTSDSPSTVAASSTPTLPGAAAGGSSSSPAPSSHPSHPQNANINQNSSAIAAPQGAPFVSNIVMSLGQTPGGTGGITSAMGIPISGRAKGQTKAPSPTGSTGGVAPSGGSGGSSIVVKSELDPLMGDNPSSSSSSSGPQAPTVPSSGPPTIASVNAATAAASSARASSSGGPKASDRERSVAGQTAASAGSGSGSGYVTNNFVAKLFG